MAASAAVALMGAGFIAYRALNTEEDLAGDRRILHGIVAPISRAPEPQWTVSAAALAEPDAACLGSPSLTTAGAACNAWVYDVGAGRPLLGIVTVTRYADAADRVSAYAVGVDRASGRTLWRSPQASDVDCDGDDAGRALCAFTTGEQIETAWLDVTTGTLGPSTAAQQRGQVNVQVLDEDGYVVMSEANGDSSPGTVTIRKIDSAGAVAWTWSAAASASNIPWLFRWSGRLYVENGSSDGRPIILDDLTGRPSSVPVEQLAGRVVVGLHRGEPVTRDGNGGLQVGNRQIGSSDASLAGLWIDDGNGRPPLITSVGSYSNSGSVLTARDPEQPEKELWSKANATAPIWCGGSLVISVRHGDTSGSAGDPDIRLTAVDPLTGAVRWESARTGEPSPDGYCDGSTLVTHNAGELEARELATGSVVWTVPLATGQEGFFSFAGTRPDEARIIMQDGEQITSLTW